MAIQINDAFDFAHILKLAELKEDEDEVRFHVLTFHTSAPIKNS